MPVHERNGGAGVRGLVLSCGGGVPGLPEVDDVRTERLPARPGKDDLAPYLGAEPHLVVAGTDADLAAVVLRLLRSDLLGEVSVGFVPASQDSAVADVYRLPASPIQALALAVRGEVDPVPLIRDDSGGVLVGRGWVGAVRGVAYCDEQTALRGAASSIEVEPDVSGGPGLSVRVTRGMVFKRPTTFSARAFQLGCVPTRPKSDGVPHPRAVTRWTWYRHTENLRLVRGLG
jgi:hypothetical protein